LMLAASSWALWPSCATYLPRNSPSARTARAQNNSPRSLGLTRRRSPPLKRLTSLSFGRARPWLS
jgi:hypothetical protein